MYGRRGPPPPALFLCTPKRFNLHMFLSSYPSFLLSFLPASLSSSLPTFLLPFLLPSYPPDYHFHSNTQFPTAPTSQTSNHQTTVEEATSSYSLHMECGGFPKEHSWFGEFLNNNFKLVKSLTLLTILSDHVDYVGEFLNDKLRAVKRSTVD